MKIINLALVVLVGLSALLFAVPDQAFADELDPAEDSGVALSPYWHSRIHQWDSLIVQEAKHRGLDPDFLSSLVWMESRGRAQAVGPVGAVGLMQIMPKEAGFDWRPTQEKLFDPGINLFWGTRTLATVIGQGNGDIFNALAAYNGGWEQIQYRGPKYFATTILRDYANAVALRHTPLSQAHWSAIFAVRKADGIVGPIWVADSAREDVYLFGYENWVPEGYPLLSPDLPPVSIVAHREEEGQAPYDVGVWFYLVDEDRWFTP